jgi:hypothetical protein
VVLEEVSSSRNTIFQIAQVLKNDPGYFFRLIPASASLPQTCHRPAIERNLVERKQFPVLKLFEGVGS